MHYYNILLSHKCHSPFSFSLDNVTTKSHFSILQGHQSKWRVTYVLNITGSMQHKQSICAKSFKSPRVFLCALSKYNFLTFFFSSSLFFLVLHTYWGGFLFSSFMSVYSSITVARVSLGGRSIDQTLDNLPVGVPLKKSIPRPRSPLTAMTHHWEEGPAEPILNPWRDVDRTNFVLGRHLQLLRT